MKECASVRNAFDVLLASARRNRPELKRFRSTDDADDNGKKPKSTATATATATETETTVRLNSFDQLKATVQLLKREPSSFDLEAVASCLLGGGDRDAMVLPFVFVCFAYELMSAESQRTVIKNIGCNMFRVAITCSSSPQETLLAILRLSSYKIVPLEEGGSDQLGIGEHNIIKAIANAYGADLAATKRRFKEVGDLGLLAQTTRSSQSKLFNFKAKPLSVSHVYSSFQEIAEVSGNDSKKKKIHILERLLAAASNCEPKYLIRLLLPKKGLGIGFSDATIIDALGCAAVFLEKENPPTFQQAVEIVKRAYAVLPVYEKIVNALFSVGVRNLPKVCGLSLGIPLEPMLSKPIGSIADVVNEFGNVPYSCEYKYDGERAQIHLLENGKVEIYSRSLERSTGKFPDVVDTVTRLKRPCVKSVILDCELVAYDRDEGKILSFQKLSTRSRKNVDIHDIKVNACIFAFDLLYLNGQSLLEEPLTDRRELHAAFEEEPGYLEYAAELTSTNVEMLQFFLEKSASESCEGLMIKQLGKVSIYEPGKRKWLKLKKDFVESMWDSLDLVPIGAYSGRGKRAGVYGTFLLACYDPETETFQTVCKAGSGLSDQMLLDFHDNFQSKVLTSAEPYYKYNADGVQPDVWFEPSEVWEVKAGGITISPAYSAAVGLVDGVDADKGLSLRNPVVLRVRADKSPKQASTAQQVAEIYSRQ
ncbi:DNA ligase 1 isoform X2 [Beta vulgaris subsp. vulgaris]|uniref:DNA ligase 1 isoform X2 n=1 Tax=Beta vulgaris subsp. vulgaris TaxID=3555 RepID=UPI00053F9387|nr:DNA ligase 1 isoform X2 [Beta vulgaris subsp. vulgaris]